MPFKVNTLPAQPSGLQNILGIFGKIGSASQAGKTVGGWVGNNGSSAKTTGSFAGDNGTSPTTTTQMPYDYAGADAAGASADGGYGAIDAAGAGAEAGSASDAILMAWKGGVVPGKAPIRGDSPVNDSVNVRTSPGELVVPRSTVSQGPKSVEHFAEMEAMKRRIGRR